MELLIALGKAFLVGGLFCAVGQVLIDKTKLTPARILVGYVVAFALGGGVGIQYTAAVAGFLFGIFFAIRYDRRLRARGGLSFTIVRLF